MNAFEVQVYQLQVLLLGSILTLSPSTICFVIIFLFTHTESLQHTFFSRVQYNDINKWLLYKLNTRLNKQVLNTCNLKHFFPQLAIHLSLQIGTENTHYKYAQHMQILFSILPLVTETNFISKQTAVFLVIQRVL